jgi:curved DNA-binding protein CbpA
MPNSQHAAKLTEGARAWNAWRSANPATAPDLNDLALSAGYKQFGPVQGGPIDLSRAGLRHAALEDATLIGANLNGAVLVQADLSYARMMGADLRGADLSQACLDQADLQIARLDGAILCGAQLHAARNLTQAQIDQARGDASTTLPPHLVAPGGWSKDAGAKPSQLARRTRAGSDDPGANPYTLLGVGRRASMREIRAAYLKLVKELHPDGRSLDPLAAERLKAINKAYHDVKVLEQRAASRRAERGMLGRPAALFVIGFLASSISLSGVLGGLYYAGLLRPNAVSQVAAETGRTEPAQVASADDDLTTGSISEHPKKTDGNVEAREVAVAQPDAADLARIRDAADDAAWAEAAREGTSASLHRYLGRHPDGRHAQKAAADLTTVVASEIALDKSYDWRDAPAAEAARQALRRHLEVYPDGRFAAEVRSKLKAIDAAEAMLLADNAAWAEAERSATGDALRGYLQAYPGGNNAAKAKTALAMIEAVEARQRADRLAWAAAEQNGSREALRGYLDAYPDGAHAATAQQGIAAILAAEARQQADRLAWADVEQDSTKETLRRYLDAYPDGYRVAEARHRLASIEAAAAEAAESERALDDAAWSRARQRNSKAAYAAYLSANPNGRHVQEAQVSLAELERAAPKIRPAERTHKSRQQASPAGTADASVSQRWPSADEPFIGADGRIRQR